MRLSTVTFRTLPQSKFREDDFSTSSKMRLSTVTFRTLPQSKLREGSYSKHVSLGGSHLIRSSVQAYKSERLVVHSSPRTLALKGPRFEFDPLQSRRTTGRASASNTRCGAAETQTVTRKSSAATIMSPPGKETLPMLDDGGSGFRGIGYTPYYRGDGSGGGSGGGGGGFPRSGDFPWGDYWFYIFMFLLRFLMMNMIGEGSCVYKYEDGRNKPIRRFG